MSFHGISYTVGLTFDLTNYASGLEGLWGHACFISLRKHGAVGTHVRDFEGGFSLECPKKGFQRKSCGSHRLPRFREPLRVICDRVEPRHPLKCNEMYNQAPCAVLHCVT